MATDISLATVEALVRKHGYRDELWLGIRAGMAVIGSLALAQRDHCLSLVYEGPASSGKSIIVRVLSSDRPATEKWLYRSDDFTPASFVSHAGDRTAEELQEIDLLPKLRDKCLVTKELGALFGEKEEKLRKSFGVLAGVLDGDGYASDSGTQGKRGYIGHYAFNWLGATTPIPQAAHKVMGTVGTRLLFFGVNPAEMSEEELLEFAQDYGAKSAVEECRKVANDFIESFFAKNPVNSVAPESVAVSPEIMRYIVRLANFIATGRAPNRECREGPQRVILLLKMLAQGLALVSGRFEVTIDDLTLLRHVAFSSIPPERRKLLLALIAGTLNAQQAEVLLGVSRPTAIREMQELAQLGFCTFTPGEPTTSSPSRIEITTPWRWLLEGYPPEKNPDYTPHVFSRVSLAPSPSSGKFSGGASSVGNIGQTQSEVAVGQSETVQGELARLRQLGRL